MPAPSGMLCSGSGEKTLVLPAAAGRGAAAGGRVALWPKAAPQPHLGVMAAGERGQLGQKSSLFEWESKDWTQEPA